MAHLRNTNIAVVNSDPNGITKLQSNHVFPLAILNDFSKIWRFVPTNPAGYKWVERKLVWTDDDIELVLAYANLGLAPTDLQSDINAAVNEHRANIGNLPSLQTSDKTSLVNAINWMIQNRQITTDLVNLINTHSIDPSATTQEEFNIAVNAWLNNLNQSTLDAGVVLTNTYSNIDAGASTQEELNLALDALIPTLGGGGASTEDALDIINNYSNMGGLVAGDTQEDVNLWLNMLSGEVGRMSDLNFSASNIIDAINKLNKASAFTSISDRITINSTVPVTVLATEITLLTEGRLQMSGVIYNTQNYPVSLECRIDGNPIKPAQVENNSSTEAFATLYNGTSTTNLGYVQPHPFELVTDEVYEKGTYSVEIAICSVWSGTSYTMYVNNRGTMDMRSNSQLIVKQV